MLQKVKDFKASHAELFQFIMFNLLSNIATITNFLVLNLSNSILFASLSTVPFSFLIFQYPVENGGLAGFLAFLLSYACAQTVNFIVQRKLVFGANNNLGKSIVAYIITVLVVYLICLYVPTLILPTLTVWVGDVWAMNLANVLNIFIQVIINYPVMKFVIMKKTDTNQTKDQGDGVDKQV